MEMCYDGTLVMPSSYAVMSEEEMTYVEGGMDPATIITLAIAICSATYGGSYVAGHWAANMGLTTYDYEKIRLNARITICMSFGVIAMIGFENGLYDHAIY